MKPRTPPRFALVGWYLMRPPLAKGIDGSWGAAGGYPDRSWAIRGVYDTAQECWTAKAYAQSGR